MRPVFEVSSETPLALSFYCRLLGEGLAQCQEQLIIKSCNSSWRSECATMYMYHSTATLNTRGQFFCTFVQVCAVGGKCIPCSQFQMRMVNACLSGVITFQFRVFFGVICLHFMLVRKF